MGCFESTPMVPPRQPAQNFNNNPSTTFYQMQTRKRPKFLNPGALNQQQRDMLWTMIQRNSLKQFAYILETQNIPSNMEIGAANTFWNFAHFCARWDAFECLLYIVKRVYAENRTLQLSLMNQQTIEGYTPLHIAIQWNAINCFYVLLDCGGVDMSYKDNANNDVFAKANLFKRTEMAQVLEKFRVANALMVLIQPETVRNFKNFSEMAASGQNQNRKQYRLTNERINYIIDTPNRLNRPPPPPPPPIQNQANNYQKYQNNMKQIEQQRPQNSSEEMEESSFEAINRKKLEEQARFQAEQDRIKKEQANELRRRIDAQKEEEEKRLRAQMETQIRKEKVFEAAQLAKIYAEKEQIKKNLELMMSNPGGVHYSGKPTKMVCPQDILPIYEAALAKKTKFVDESFPARKESLGDVHNFRFGWEDCVWLRPEQMFPNGKFEVFDGISADDIKQGTLGVCYYLALLSSICEHEKRIKKIFRFYDKDLGFYAIQLYLEGKPITMIVDDQIPCLNGTKQPLFSKPNGAEVWVMIFEKAWVKLFGNYLASEKMNPAEMFQNVLSAPCKGVTIDVSKIDQIFDELIEDDKKQYIMTASSLDGDHVPDGIVKEHAYSLIGLYNINGTRICKIRNPWGKTEYSGMYSETSSLWTAEMKKIVGFKDGNDGVFFLTSTQLQSIMPFIAVSLVRDDYCYSYIQLLTKSNQHSHLIVNIQKKGQIAVKVTQQNQRFKKSMQFQNAPVRLEIYKLGENYDAKVISEGEPSCMYGDITTVYSKLQIYENLQPGRYMIRVKILYDRAQLVSTRGTMRKFIRGTDGKNISVVREGKSVLSMYGPESYIFNQITTTEAEKYMRNAYRNVVLNQKEQNIRLRSVGQDLKPTVQARDAKMKNQVIYYAENFLEKNSINFKFQFNHTLFRNVSFSYSHNIDRNKECCEWVINPGGWNVAALEIDCPFQEVATEGELKTDYKIMR